MELYFPSMDSVVNAGNQIRVSGIARDNADLSTLVIQLKDSAGNVSGSESYPIQGREMPFNFWFTAGDRYTPNGNFRLEVVAMDAAGNSGDDEGRIRILETPLQLYRIFFVKTESQTLVSGIYSLDSTLSGTALEKMPGYEVAGLVCDNRNQILGYTTRMTANFAGLDPWNTGTEFFFKTEANPAQTAVFSSLSSDGNRFAAAMEIPPYLKLYHTNGSTLASFTDAGYPAKSICMTNSLVVAGMESGNGAASYVNGFNLNTRMLQFGYDGLSKQEGLHFDGQHKLIAWGRNAQGQSKIAVLDADDLSVNKEMILTDTLQGNASFKGDFYFFCGGNLCRLKADFSGWETVITGLAPEIYGMGYDPVHKQILLALNGEIGIWDTGGNEVRRIPFSCGPNARITHFACHLNK